MKGIEFTGSSGPPGGQRQAARATLLGARQGSQQDHYSRLQLEPSRPYSRAPSPFEEAAGRQGLVPRGPMAHLSSSPQAEVSHIIFQPGALHPGFLPPQQRQPCLALCLGPEHRGRPEGEGREARGRAGWPGSWLMVAFSVGIPPALRPSLFTTLRHHGLHGA